MSDVKSDGIGATIGGQMRVCDALEMGALSTQGWRLFRVLEIDEIGTSNEQLPGSLPGYSPVYFTRSFPMRSVRFLMVLDEESALSQTQTENVRLARRAAADEGLRKQAEEKLATLQAAADAAHAGLERSIRNLSERLERTETQRDTSAAQVRAMEVDLGKVRKEVGEGRMREILAAGTDSGRGS